MPAPLINAAAEHARIIADLRDMFGNDDQQALLDTAAGLTSFTEILEAVMRSREDDLEVLPGLKQRIDDLRTRYDRIEARAEAKRQVVEQAMLRADYLKHRMPEMTLTLGKRPAKVIVTDEAMIPPEYYSTPAPVLSKSRVKEALEDGTVVPGATLSNSALGLNIRKR